MPAHKQVDASSASDIPDRLGVAFGVPGSSSGEMSWTGFPSCYCESLTVKVGPKPSHAKIVIPCDSNDEAANMVAFDPGGPARNIKIGTQCVVSKVWTDSSGSSKGMTLFVGKVQLIEFDRDNDQLIIDAVDARADLRELYIIGRWVHVPVDDEGHAAATSFQQGWPAHFNPGGRPNCIFDGATQRPEFAPYPDYGLDGSEEPDMSAADFSRASYWTLGRMFDYLRNHYGPDAAGVSQWPLLPKAPAWLVWPETLGNLIDQEDVANFDSGLGQGTQSTGGARKGREVILEGYGLLESLDLLLSIAGGYSLAMTPKAEEKDGGSLEVTNTLGIVSTKYNGRGISLPWASSGRPEVAAITGGTFIEDGEDFVTSIMGRSQLCFVERRFTTFADPEHPKPLEDETLKPAWKTSRETDFKKAIISLGNTEEAYREACTLFPEVYTTWVVNSQFDYLQGTPWENYPRAKMARTPWPTQMSFMTDMIGSKDYAGLRWPIYVEICTDEDVWTRGPLFDGLEIFDTGVIHLPALRDLGAAVKVFAGSDGGTSTVPFAKDNQEAAKIEVRDIRMNLAIPCDHGIGWAVTAPGTDFGTGTGVFEIEISKNPNPDQDRIDESHARRKFVDLQQLYAAIYRTGSYYKPESCGGTASASEYVRNDLTLLQSHIRRMMNMENRLRKGGAPRIDGFIVPYPLGTSIESLSSDGKAPFPIRANITGIRFTSTGGDRPATGTELLFGD